MDQLVVCANTVDPDAIRAALPELDVHPVRSRLTLVEALVGNPSLAGAVVEFPEFTPEWEHFLLSVRASFPLLPIHVLIPGGGCLEGLECFDNADEPSVVVARIRDSFTRERRRDRRAHHRYDWPLSATIGDAPTAHRVREISAGGAFLEPRADGIEPGQEDTIAITFQNFTLRTACRILDPRRVSSLIKEGFGVRFLSLSPQGVAFVDRVVNDALARVLLDPNAEPEVPTIDEEEDVLAIGDEFSISL